MHDKWDYHWKGNHRKTMRRNNAINCRLYSEHAMHPYIVCWPFMWRPHIAGHSDALTPQWYKTISRYSAGYKIMHASWQVSLFINDLCNYFRCNGVITMAAKVSRNLKAPEVGVTKPILRSDIFAIFHHCQNTDTHDKLESYSKNSTGTFAGWKIPLTEKSTNGALHDDVIKWKHFPCYWPFVRGIHRSRWIPRTKASDAELWCFIWSAPE